MLGNLKNVKPGTADDWKTNVQDNNQKPTDVCPARTTAAILLKLKITTSCPNIAKPHVGSSYISVGIWNVSKLVIFLTKGRNNGFIPSSLSINSSNSAFGAW